MPSRLRHDEKKPVFSSDARKSGGLRRRMSRKRRSYRFRDAASKRIRTPRATTAAKDRSPIPTRAVYCRHVEVLHAVANGLTTSSHLVTESYFSLFTTCLTLSERSSTHPLNKGVSLASRSRRFGTSASTWRTILVIDQSSCRILSDDFACDYMQTSTDQVRRAADRFAKVFGRTSGERFRGKNTYRRNRDL